MIAPSTDIILYKSDLELDNTNQLKFNTWTDQWNYFSNLPHIYLDNATYQRKEGVIRFPTTDISFDELIRYNYVSYKNEAYANKTFFAYVKNMRYVNDGMTEIEIETDPYQSWQFDLIYRRCFVEREHVRDDTIGKHTIPEGLETGEYIIQSITDNEKDSFNYLKPGSTAYDHPIIVMATSDTGGTSVPSGSKLYGGIYSGLYYLAFPTGGDAENFIYDLTTGFSSKVDAIYAIFMVPASLLDLRGSDYFTPSGKNYEMAFVPYTTESTYMLTGSIIDTYTLGSSYHPKNNKTLCFPYRYITVSNNAGSTNHYKYEYFEHEDIAGTPNQCMFAIEGTVSIGCSIKCTPRNYNISYTDPNVNTQLIEGVDAYKLPTCTWLTDPFLNWLSENSINIIGGTAVEVGEIVAGMAMMSSNPAMGGVMAVGGATGIFNTVKEGFQKALDPKTANGGQNQGNYNFAKGLGFSVYKYSIRDEYAKIIDDYFTMFGYKVNALKVPNIHSRKNWNYVKTIDCNFSGDIPGKDLVKLRQMFDNGITIWHNPSTFLDYSQSNYII